VVCQLEALGGGANGPSIDGKQKHRAAAISGPPEAGVTDPAAIEGMARAR